MKRLLRFLGPLLVVLVFLASIWLIYRELHRFGKPGESLVQILSHIGSKVWEISPTSLALALGLTVINYLILVGYDWVAVHFIGQRLPLRRVALASFTGYACSYNFGATLAGTTIRLRLYSAWGMATVKILELLVILGLTFWFGLFGLAGVIFIIDPPPINRPQQVALEKLEQARKAPPGKTPGAEAKRNHEQAGQNANGNSPDPDEARRLKRKEVLERILFFAADLRFWGFVLLAIGLVYLGISATSLTHIKIFGHELPVPPFKLTVYQFVIVAADMLVAGAVLYALMHHIPGVGTYAELLGIYILVYVAVVLTHVPGGYGVFEAGMLFCLARASAVHVPVDSVMAAIFVFRVIYFWGPLALAIPLLAINEMLIRRRARTDDAAPPPAPANS